MTASATPLHIERRRGMVDVYVLLGLSHWESDAAVIREAIAVARRQLNQVRQTASPRDYSQLSGHVTEAERLLTDPARKQRYDEALRAVIGDERVQQVASAERSDDRGSEDAPQTVAVIDRQVFNLASLAGTTETDATNGSLQSPSVASVPFVPLIVGANISRTINKRSIRAAVVVRMTLLERLTSFGRAWLSWLIDKALSVWEMLHGGHPLRLTLALVLVASVIGFWISQVDWSETFPEHAQLKPEHAQLKAVGDQTLTARLSPKPVTESIPGQRVGHARSLPGLEASSGFAPTLNAKLTVIVFSVETERDSRRHFDLQAARRDHVTSSFRLSDAVKACATDDDETDPALSPDGLELIFVRKTSEGDSQLWRCVRESLEASFSEPELVSIPELPSSKTSHVSAPQIVSDGGDVLFRLKSRSSDETPSIYYFASRKGLNEPFEPARKLPVFVDDARHFVMSDGLHVFVARYHGFQLCVRPTSSAPFSPPSPIEQLSALQIGRAEGPFWVSPAEDFLVYCSSVAHRGQQQRQLRQVRIR